ncbi:MAG: regulatory protein GemA [Pseudomonadota bacterium]
MKTQTNLQEAARPATFDASQKSRRSMIGKVHVAKKQLALIDDDYRQILLNETGQTSLAACTSDQLLKVIKRLEALGFKPVPAKGTRPAQHKMAKKARALWISLYHLGVVRNPDERALEVFAKRQLKCEKLVWAKQSHGFRLVEALKAMAVEGGWRQTDRNGNNLSVRALQEGLCEAILTKLIKLGEVPSDWTIDIAAWRLCGIETAAFGPITADGYNAIAKALGDKLRAAGGAQ